MACSLLLPERWVRGNIQVQLFSHTWNAVLTPLVDADIPHMLHADQRTHIALRM